MKARPVILHVDDDANDRLLAQTACKRAGLNWELHSVADGEAAVGYLKGSGEYGNRATHPFPNLVLLDLKLPRKSGFEVLGWVRDEHFGPRFPIVMLTSSGQEGDITQATEGGASDYYVKPVSLRELETILKTIDHKWLGALSHV